tara:strand:+ start:4494 stop:5198 length:705 start_codon:yes stop_codon:yes gene_type:complete
MNKMKVVILCGGLGTRLSEETHKVPKPLIKLGDKTILDYIIEHFSKYNFNEILICGGYKISIFKKHYKNKKNIKIINTGMYSQTGARIKKIKKFLGKDQNFFLTYGDGLSNVNIQKLLNYHEKHGKIATLTAVRPIPRFGHLTLKKDNVIRFKEKDRMSVGWINGGFFVLNKKIFKYISKKNNEIFEKKPLEKLSRDSQLKAYKFNGFWHCVDTLRDKNYLISLLKLNKAPWIN